MTETMVADVEGRGEESTGMASEFTEQTAARDDARYREGMACLQEGEWQEAVECFEELLRKYPGSNQVEQALEGARLKADLDAGARIRARRWAVPWRSLIVGGLTLLTTVALGWVLVRVVLGRVIPTAREAQAQEQRGGWLRQARNHLEAGELDAAQAGADRVLQQDPDNGEALDIVGRVAEERLLRDLYEQAVALQEAGKDEQAREQFREILGRRPDGYRDVQDRLAVLQRSQDIEDAFAEAESLYQAGRALDAIAAYERVREMNVSYERDVVEDRLFELYMEVGRQIVDGPQEQELQQAVVYFVRALSLRPSSPQASLEHRLAVTCSEGFSAYRNQVWGQALAQLKAVFDERADYLGGIVAQRLYLAYIRLGEQYEAAGNVHLAYEQYQKALELPVDTTLARQRIEDLAPRLTPTPTPTPAPTRTPAPPRAPWGGDQVQKEQNLLTNPSFEGGWYDIYTGQVPDGWRVLWLDGVRFPGSADVALAPETIVGKRINTPEDERDLLFLFGSQQHLKVFKGFAPMYAAVVQDVSGLDVGRQYQLVAPIFVDVYAWQGRKVAPGGESARVRLGAAPQGATWRDEEAISYSEWWDGNNTSGFFLQYSDYVFEFEATQSDMTIYIEMAGIYGMSNNGFFLDDVALHPVGVPTEPADEGTSGSS